MVKEIKKPKSVAIIMDGNRRWAKKRGLSVTEGHRAAYNHLYDFLRWAKGAGINNVAAYALSLKNWERSPEEVSDLVSLIREIFVLKSNFVKYKISVKFIGKLDMFPKDLQDEMNKLERKTSKFNGQQLALAVSYDGRVEIVQALNKLVKKGVKKLTEKDISKNLYHRNFPDPDIIIRTAGDKRLSGFMPWQSVYSELFFSEKFWPEFTKKDFLKILERFGKIERRMGK